MEFHLLSIFNCDDIKEVVFFSIKTKSHNRALFYIGHHKNIGFNLELLFLIVFRNY